MVKGDWRKWHLVCDIQVGVRSQKSNFLKVKKLKM